MKVLLFGSSGMVGQGVLRECLLDPDVKRVVAVGRSPLGQSDPKLGELIVTDFYDYAAVESKLKGFDACFFCLGVSSVGMSEAEYRRLSYDLPLAAATVLARLNPQMTFTFVTGAGCDSSERGAMMWARVKGAAENALLKLPFKGAYMFRPGIIQPLHGVRSKTPLYQTAYNVAGPLFSVIGMFAPNKVTTSEKVGRAMLAVAKRGAPSPFVEMADINRLGG
ncbi:epimerase [Variovorax robiniae]|uniref:Epimerase n=1 Tax=Variovorax robiniae TaxID=1836199 RepID=A0ABU8X2I3_9BURK